MAETETLELPAPSWLFGCTSDFEGVDSLQETFLNVPNFKSLSGFLQEKEEGTLLESLRNLVLDSSGVVLVRGQISGSRVSDGEVDLFLAHHEDFLCDFPQTKRRFRNFHGLGLIEWCGLMAIDQKLSVRFYWEMGKNVEQLDADSLVLECFQVLLGNYCRPSYDRHHLLERIRSEWMGTSPQNDTSSGLELSSSNPSWERKDPLNILLGWAKDGVRTICLSGLAGIGKSWLADEYLKARMDCSGRFWISARSEEDFWREFTHRNWHIPELDALRGMHRQGGILNWLSSHPGWVMVVDGVEDQWFAKLYSTYSDVFSHGQVVVTCRQGLSLLGSKQLVLRALPDVTTIPSILEATQGVRYEVSEDRALSLSLFHSLGGNPQALHWMLCIFRHGTRSLSLGDYQGQLESAQALEIKEEYQGLNGVALSLIASWKVAWNHLTKESQFLLVALSVFEGISLWTPLFLDSRALKRLKQLWTDFGGEALEEDFPFEDCVQELRGLGMALPESYPSELQISSVASLLARFQGREDQHRQCWMKWVELILERLQEKNSEWSTLWQSLEGSVEALLRSPFAETISGNAISLQLHYARYLHVLEKRFDQAKNHYFKALKQAGELLGQDHPDYLGIRKDLALVYQDMGQYEKAGEILQGLLDEMEAALGNDHPETLSVQGQWANWLATQGRFEESRAVCKNAYDAVSKFLSDDNPVCLSLLNNLGAIHIRLGEYKEANHYLGRAVALSQKFLGKEHLDTLTSMHNLAIVLDALGQWEEPEKIYRQVYLSRERQLGIGHSDTLSSLSNLGQNLCQKRKFAQAAQCFHQLQAIATQVFGEQSIEVITALNNLGMTYVQWGKGSEGYSFLVRSLTLRKALLGECHPSILSVMTNLGVILHDQGKMDQALVYYKDVVRLSEQWLGADHPDTLSSLTNLAIFYYHKQEYPLAREQFEKALKISTKSLGPNHPSTLEIRYQIANTLQADGNSDDARRLYEQILVIHPSEKTPGNTLAQRCRLSLLGLSEDVAVESLEERKARLRRAGLRKIMVKAAIISGISMLLLLTILGYFLLT